MKKCLKCNISLTDDVTKCPNCGSDELSDIIQNPSQKGKTRATLLQRVIFTLFIIVAAASIIGYIYFEKIIPGSPVESSIAAIYKGDAEAHLAAIPPNVRDSERKFLTQAYGTNDEYSKFAKEQLKMLGNNIKINVQVLNVEKMSSARVIQLKDELKDVINSDIQSAAYVTVKIKIVGDDS